MKIFPQSYTYIYSFFECVTPMVQRTGALVTEQRFNLFTASLTAKCVKYFDLASVCLKSFFFWGGGTRFLEQHFRDQFPGQVRLLSMLKVSKSVLFACTVLKWNHSRCIGTSCVELLRFLLLYNENTQVVSVIVGLWLDRHTNHPSNNRSSKYCAQ